MTETSQSSVLLSFCRAIACLEPSEGKVPRQVSFRDLPESGLSKDAIVCHCGNKDKKPSSQAPIVPLSPNGTF